MSEFVNIEDYREDIESYIPHFVFYRRGYHSPTVGSFGEFFENERNSKITDCYCTACHTRYEDGIRPLKHYKHKELSTCTNCGTNVELRQMDRGRKTYYHTSNYAVFEGAGDRMRISCIKVYQRFIDPDDLEPELYWEEVARYELQPKAAVKYSYRWNHKEKSYCWGPLKAKPSEPNYNTSFFYGDYSYTCINKEALRNSFLKYVYRELEDLNIDTNYIVWLCRCAEHPQIEYFLKGGVPRIADRVVNGWYSSRPPRLNWKSNDLKKILKISKPELDYFIEHNGDMYESYISFRRNFFQGKTPSETIAYFQDFSGFTDMIQEIEQLTGFSRKKIMDYARRKQNGQGTYFFIVCYRDYLRECVKLNYDMESTVVTMPKDMFAAHERTASLLVEISDKAVNTKLHKTDEKRRDLEVVDMELGLVLSLPKSVHDIAEEGARLSHCVGGYAERHAEGALTIMFLRTLSHPGTSFYTMEVSKELRIVQCRGYRNNNAHNPKPEIIKEFERRYAEYLKDIKEQRKKSKEKAKRKQQRQKKLKTAA